MFVPSRKHHPLRAGFTVEDILQPIKIDRGFLTPIEEVVSFEEELAATEA